MDATRRGRRPQSHRHIYQQGLAALNPQTEPGHSLWPSSSLLDATDSGPLQPPCPIHHLGSLSAVVHHESTRISSSAAFALLLHGTVTFSRWGPSSLGRSTSSRFLFSILTCFCFIYSIFQTYRK